VALVGRNGCGKSTLIKILAGEFGDKNGCGRITSGKIWKSPNIRTGYISQYSVEELDRHGQLTIVEYAEQYLASGRASSRIIADSGGSKNVRQYLGAFGLGGTDYAHRKIKTLSGGERMRLCFATVRLYVLRICSCRYLPFLSLIHT
jgi:ATPase subunit of ABC transporter with duplicated ATPase domains